MTNTQQIFIVFYAIFWGAVANAQPKWKAFHWPLLFRCAPASRRLLLSFIFLSILPIAFFSWTLLCLAGTGTGLGIKETLLGVVPAVAIFGFYRLWLGFVELGRDVFYRKNASLSPYYPAEIEPTVESLSLDTKIGGWWNVLYGFVYVVAGFVVTSAFTVSTARADDAGTISLWCTGDAQHNDDPLGRNTSTRYAHQEGKAVVDFDHRQFQFLNWPITRLDKDQISGKLGAFSTDTNLANIELNRLTGEAYFQYWVHDHNRKLFWYRHIFAGKCDPAGKT